MPASKKTDAHLFHGINRDFDHARVAPQSCIAIVTKQQNEGRQHVGEQPPWVGNKSRPPHLHRVQQWQAEHQPTRHAAPVFLKGFG